jgi:hypothetical protein
MEWIDRVTKLLGLTESEWMMGEDAYDKTNYYQVHVYNLGMYELDNLIAICKMNQLHLKIVPYDDVIISIVITEDMK